MGKLKLSADQKKELIAAVRSSIEKKLFGQPVISMPDLSSAVFSEHFGLFVTLTADENLRGCIGFIEGIKPIREAVIEMALQAAFHDPRFYPLTKEEYSSIQVEISILYPLEKVTKIEEIEVGRDGLVMERGYHRGLLLPQVATEYGWDRETFLNQTCHKAGMEPYCWENGAEISKFEAVIFNENKME